MSEELRPCPLCGAMPDKLRTGYMCSTLGCALQEHTVSEKEWNTRPIEDALTARIAELEGFIGQLIEAGNDIALIANDILEFDGKSGEFTPIAEKWQALVKNRKEV